MCFFDFEHLTQTELLVYSPVLKETGKLYWAILDRSVGVEVPMRDTDLSLSPKEYTNFEANSTDFTQLT